MSSTHTPGPWSIKWTTNVFSGERLVANCGGHSSNRDSERVQDENNANAALVAAAPDLLAACEAALKELVAVTLWDMEGGHDYGDGSPEQAAILAKLESAISKARGHQ